MSNVSALESEYKNQEDHVRTAENHIKEEQRKLDVLMQHLKKAQDDVQMQERKISANEIELSAARKTAMEKKHALDNARAEAAKAEADKRAREAHRL